MKETIISLSQYYLLGNFKKLLGKYNKLIAINITYYKPIAISIITNILPL